MNMRICATATRVLMCCVMFGMTTTIGNGVLAVAQQQQQHRLHQKQHNPRHRTFFGLFHYGNRRDVRTSKATKAVAVATSTTTTTGTSFADNQKTSKNVNGSGTDDMPQQLLDNNDHLRPEYVRNLLRQQEQYKNQVQKQENGGLLEQTEKAILSEPTIYYFGLGSNMLRSKVESRGSGFGPVTNTTSNNTVWNNNTIATTTTSSTSGTNNTATNTNIINNSTNSKIHLLSMEPGYVQNYRLSFNLRGFCPLEPGMGSLEPIPSTATTSSTTTTTCQPLHAYEYPECHGALIQLTMENYEKLMRTEGVGPNVTNPSYEEILITVIPYNTSKEPVTAIALRAREHVRLKKIDPAPSVRYMNILREGAAELQLKSSYQNFLQTHPTQYTPRFIQRIAIYNLICTMSIATKFKWRGISKLQSLLLYNIYIPTGLSHIPQWRYKISFALMSIILFPCACIGKCIQWYCTLRKKEFSPMMQRFISMIDTPPITMKNHTSDLSKFTTYSNTTITTPIADTDTVFSASLGRTSLAL